MVPWSSIQWIAILKMVEKIVNEAVILEDACLSGESCFHM